MDSSIEAIRQLEAELANARVLSESLEKLGIAVPDEVLFQVEEIEAKLSALLQGSARQ